MSNLYPNGIGGTGVDSLVSARPLFMSGAVYYVHSGTGTDAAGTAGQNREKPLATLAQAVTNAANGDVICFLSGHTQTLTAAQTIAKNLTLIGEGSSGGQPTVQFTLNAAAGNMLTVSGTAVKLRNLKFKANAQSNGSPRISANGAMFEMKHCYVECAGTDTGPAVRLGASSLRFANCTFISTSTSTSSQPDCCIDSSLPFNDVDIEGCTFSSGTSGFSRFYAIDLSSGPVTRLRGESISLLLGADAQLEGCTGYFNVQTNTGGSRVVGF